MIPADHAAFREAARAFLLELERIEADREQGKPQDNERNHKLFDHVARELAALLARMPQGMNGVFYRGWIFQRKTSGQLSITKADSIVSIED